MGKSIAKQDLALILYCDLETTLRFERKKFMVELTK